MLSGNVSSCSIADRLVGNTTRREVNCGPWKAVLRFGLDLNRKGPLVRPRGAGHSPHMAGAASGWSARPEATRGRAADDTERSWARHPRRPGCHTAFQRNPISNTEAHSLPASSLLRAAHDWSTSQTTTRTARYALSLLSGKAHRHVPGYPPSGHLRYSSPSEEATDLSGSPSGRMKRPHTRVS